jgi:hypothetical protein
MFIMACYILLNEHFYEFIQSHHVILRLVKIKGFVKTMPMEMISHVLVLLVIKERPARS